MDSGAGDENAVPTKEEEQVQVPACCFVCFSHAWVISPGARCWHDLFHLHLRIFAECIMLYASILYD